ncbi:hypothetical protein D3C74_305670 [compost metagenome]
MTKRPSRSLVSRPTVPVRPASSPRASALGWNDKRSAASMTRVLVSALTWSRPLSALEAVATETPASRATSVSVTERLARSTGGDPPSSSRTIVLLPRDVPGPWWVRRS